MQYFKILKTSLSFKILYKTVILTFYDFNTLFSNKRKCVYNNIFLYLRMDNFFKKGRSEDLISQPTATPSMSKDAKKDEIDHISKLSYS